MASLTEAVVPATVPALKSRMMVDTTVSTSCPQKLRSRCGTWADGAFSAALGHGTTCLDFGASSWQI